ncbi:MAG: hypothetical protein HY536_02065 [Candidatus Colwellbacteria bacterium]|nr:hypothetical protein [Candidatus Colwellbacteria bacterium]
MEGEEEWRRFWEEDVPDDTLAQVTEHLSARSFSSGSSGKGRRRRRWPREVILILLRGRVRWIFWDGTDRPRKGLRWDVWATEVFGESFCEGLFARGTHPDEYFRREVLRLLKKYDGRI